MYTRFKHLCRYLFIGLATCITHNVIANTTSMGTPKVLNADHWAQFSAQNALDIIENVPEFTLVEKPSERGLSNATVNILINGVPSIPEHSSPQAYLKQIPIDQIKRADFYNTNHPYSVASQFSQLINIITHKNNSQTTLYTEFAQQADRIMLDNIALKIAMPWQGWNHQFSANSQNSRYISTADIYEQTPNNIANHIGGESYKEKDKSHSLSLTSRLENQKNLLQLTINNEKNNYHESTLNLFSTNSKQLFLENTQKSQLNVGVDWQYKGLGTWQLHSVASLKNMQDKTHTHATFFSSTTHSRPQDSSVFMQTQNWRELAAKVILSQPTHALSPELGIAYSRNELIASTLPSEAQSPHYISSDIQEIRYEPYVKLQYALNQNWQVYARINAESAKLTTLGNDSFEFSKVYIKPFVRLSFDNKSTVSISATLKQQVKQLDFEPFIASEESNYDRAFIGNLRLKPMKYDELEMQANYVPNTLVNINLNTFYQWQRDIHEYTLLSDTEVGIGNAGSAQYFGTDLQITLQADKIVPNSRLEMTHTYRHAIFNDSITGKRAITGLTPQQLNLDFKQDFNALSWGVHYQKSHVYTEYYYDEIYTEKTAPQLSFFTEFNFNTTTNMRFNLAAFGRDKTEFKRQVFALNRANSLLRNHLYYDVAKPKMSLTVTLKL
ncbi:hypothetical protein [Pseudoalteromonas sp. MMG012]|uniref:hypothetical protein n=1 Tax=Pseudoalteromonas sp. MMG012 TaxID=2822686 RepID=UPI001B3A1A7A|nr:hypothetical protein [Pseudoalteromonas sp. MMG012]MBQ4850316.1 hypothetical protein [Pseudoalteromonas sp. MMG012]